MNTRKTKFIGDGYRGPAVKLAASAEGFKDASPAERAARKKSVSEIDAARPVVIAAADEKEKGERVLGIPERWFRPPGPQYRCQRGHVRHAKLDQTDLGYPACIECRTAVYITFPEDVDDLPDLVAPGTLTKEAAIATGRSSIYAEEDTPGKLATIYRESAPARITLTREEAEGALRVAFAASNSPTNLALTDALRVEAGVVAALLGHKLKR